MSLPQKTFFVLALLLMSQSYARPLSSAERACVFAHPLTFGASISAETPLALPGYHAAISARALARGIFYLPDFGVSPTRVLLASYAHKWPFQMGPNFSRMFARDNAALGSSQVQAMLGGEHQSEFNAASVILSMDAFYWDAISNTCGYDVGPGVEYSVENLINASHAQGKFLILGNVPHEDPATVLIDSETLGIPGLWYNPDPTCVTSINNTLQRLCTLENGCYLIDIDKMVATLDGGGTLALHGKQYSLYWIRPDGVHLSMYGADYLYQHIVEALEANPPKCTAP
jgi:hypothetical protein